MAEIEGDLARNHALIARAEQQISEIDLSVVDLRTSAFDEALGGLRDVDAEIKDLSERIGSATDILERTIIRAPVTGTVVGLNVTTTGAVIAPGERLMDLVPSEEKLIIEARVDPGDIDIVRPGLLVQARLTAFPHRSSPILNGRLVQASADRMIDDRTGMPYYTARAELDDDALTATARSVPLSRHARRGYDRDGHANGPCLYDQADSLLAQ